MNIWDGTIELERAMLTALDKDTLLYLRKALSRYPPGLTIKDELEWLLKENKE